jgi:hypothetical protein
MLRSQIDLQLEHSDTEVDINSAWEIIRETKNSGQRKSSLF